MLQGEQIYKN